MVLTPVMSRVRATAAVSGGAAMVCLTCAAFTALPAATTSPAPSGSGQSARLVAQVTLMPTSATIATTHGVPAAGGLGGGPGGGPGGGSDGSAGDAVAPSPAKHGSSSGSSSSSSGGSTGHHVASGESPGLVAGIFKKVGHWLGLSSDDSKASGEAAAPKPAKPAGASSGNASTGSASSEGSGGASAGGAAGGKPADASGVGDLIHSIFAGIGRLFSGLFGG